MLPGLRPFQNLNAQQRKLSLGIPAWSDIYLKCLSAHQVLRKERRMLPFANIKLTKDAMHMIFNRTDFNNERISDLLVAAPLC